MGVRIFCCLALLLGASRLASGGDVEGAKAHYKAGVAAYTLGDYTRAASEYEAAYSAEPDPALLYNAAQAHRFAGNKQRALFLYQNYLRFFPNRTNKAEVLRHIKNLQVAIDSDTTAKNAPPSDPLSPEGKRHAVEPPKEPVVAKDAVVKADTSGGVVATRPEKKKTPAWVWGVVGGSIAVVAVGLGVGLGVGLSGTSYPSADLGSVRLK